MTPAFKQYRVGDLKRNPKNPGGGKRYDEQELLHLQKSLRQRQWMPIIVKEPEMYVLDGNRRLAAAQLGGIDTLSGIPVMHELTAAEINRLIAQLDIRHQPFSEIARGKLWLAIREENGWTNVQLAQDLGVSASLLTKVFGNLENSEEIQQMVEDGGLSLRDGYYLSRIEDVTERLRLAHEIAAGRVKAESVAGLVRKQKAPDNNATPPARVSRITCPLPSGVTVTISGHELSLDDAIEAAGELLKVMKKASQENLDGKTFSAVCARKAKTERDVP
ncbi:MAG TPA: ParB/RepB/Spo0J family partition protein [Gemmataceae bacterium]|nr:ParB/RepB/Spo0J family partition protein [Gemmataceae bacterium]